MDAVVSNSLDILSFVSTITGEIDQKKMQFCLWKMLEIHPSLKTRFVTADGKVKRELFHIDELPLYFLSMNFQSSGHLKNFVSEYAEKQRKALSKRDNGPLFSCSIIKYDFQTYLFFLTMDQIICDDRSIKLFLDDLLKFYAEANDNSSSQ